MTRAFLAHIGHEAGPRQVDRKAPPFIVGLKGRFS